MLRESNELGHEFILLGSPEGCVHDQDGDQEGVEQRQHRPQAQVPLAV